MSSKTIGFSSTETKEWHLLTVNQNNTPVSGTILKPILESSDELLIYFEYANFHVVLHVDCAFILNAKNFGLSRYCDESRSGNYSHVMEINTTTFDMTFNFYSSSDEGYKTYIFYK